MKNTQNLFAVAFPWPLYLSKYVHICTLQLVQTKVFTHPYRAMVHPIIMSTLLTLRTWLSVNHFSWDFWHLPFNISLPGSRFSYEPSYPCNTSKNIVWILYISTTLNAPIMIMNVSNRQITQTTTTFHISNHLTCFSYLSNNVRCTLFLNNKPKYMYLVQWWSSSSSPSSPPQLGFPGEPVLWGSTGSPHPLGLQQGHGLTTHYPHP